MATKQKTRKTVTKVTKKPTTALARRDAPPQIVELRVNDPGRMLPVANESTALGLLSDEAAVGNLGMVEVRLTDAEESILSEAVNPDDVLVKPNGIAYLSHPVYTKWFNRAFGRLGWALVPKAKAIKAGNLVVVPYVLYIHGQPAAFAQGEQDYFDSNKTQTFGDAIEATVASGLRRCAKRLGVGLELWDKRWLQQFMDTHAEQVGGEWRLIRDRRPATFRGGNAGGGKTVAQEQRQTPPKAGTHAAEGEKITDVQRARLVNIAQRAGRIDADVALWLKARYKVANSRDILRRDYDAICDQLAVRGALPMPGDGE